LEKRNIPFRFAAIYQIATLKRTDTKTYAALVLIQLAFQGNSKEHKQDSCFSTGTKVSVGTGAGPSVLIPRPVTTETGENDLFIMIASFGV
jgi:hypothetical protein